MDIPANSQILLWQQIHHRTVIVTAAVHPGLGPKLALRIGGVTPGFYLRALGRLQPLYLPLRVGRDLCFS